MPEFCRHGRFVHNCRICSPPAERAPGARPAAAPGSSGASGSSSGSRSRGGLVVRRAARSADDGYAHALVPGLKASGDAQRLVDELAFAAARLEELAVDPPGLYAEVAGAGDHEESTWLAFLITYLAPTVEAPFAAIHAVRTPWAADALPDLDGTARGPRSSHDPARGEQTLAAYRAWAARHGGQAAAFTGEASWSSQRRFDRLFERLALPGFGRAGRYELLVALGALGLYDLRPTALRVEDDATTLAAKRVLGIGDRVNLERRAAALAEGLELEIAPLDLAFFNWGQPHNERATMGSRAQADPALRDRLAAALGL